MNVFATWPCPVKSASWLDDQRQIKMILESAQMLSSANFIYGQARPELLKMTHSMHPCVLWVCEARDNFDWLWEHMLALDSARCRRVTAKDPKTHAAVQRLQACKAFRVKRLMPKGSTPHVNCARNTGLGVDFTHIADVHKAYRLYLYRRWELQAKPAVCTLRSPK